MTIVTIVTTCLLWHLSSINIISPVRHVHIVQCAISVLLKISRGQRRGQKARSYVMIEWRCCSCCCCCSVVVMMMMMMMLSAAAADDDDDDDDDDDEDAINALRLRHCETFYRHFETRLLEPKWKKRWQIKTETERSSMIERRWRPSSTLFDNRQFIKWRWIATWLTFLVQLMNKLVLK